MTTPKIGRGEDFPNISIETDYVNGSLFIRTDLPNLPIYQLEINKDGSHQWRRVSGVNVKMTTLANKIQE